MLPREKAIDGEGEERREKGVRPHGREETSDWEKEVAK